jgi:GNAT superfamily N-acetyltransferase
MKTGDIGRRGWFATALKLQNRALPKKIRNNGWAWVLGKALDSARDCVLLRNKIYVYQLNIEKCASEIDVPLGLTYRIASRSDILRLDKEKHDYDRKAKRYLLNRLKHGDRCIFALADEEIIGHMWIMKARMEMSQGRLMRLSSERAYIYKGFVIKEARGQRVLAGLDQFAVELLRNEGFQLIVTTVESSNYPAIAARKRKGFVKIGEIWQYRICGVVINRIEKDIVEYLKGPSVG